MSFDAPITRIRHDILTRCFPPAHIRTCSFDIVGGSDAIYVSVTSDGSRLFALFVTGAGPGEADPGRLIRESLVTLNLK